MMRLVEWCDTPCVHTAAAVIPGTNGRPSPTELASVLLTRVTSIARSPSGDLEAWLDARLGACRPLLSETRLIGRVSTIRDAGMTLRTASDDAVSQLVSLPGDLRIGDILAIPCVGVTALHDVRLTTEQG